MLRWHPLSIRIETPTKAKERWSTLTASALARQDYRIATQPFPQGLLQGQGIHLQQGGWSAVAHNDWVFRSLQTQQRDRHHQGLEAGGGGGGGGGGDGGGGTGAGAGGAAADGAAGATAMAFQVAPDLDQVSGQSCKRPWTILSTMALISAGWG